jgi:hypothetical protein
MSDGHPKSFTLLAIMDYLTKYIKLCNNVLGLSRMEALGIDKKNSVALVR